MHLPLIGQVLYVDMLEMGAEGAAIAQSQAPGAANESERNTARAT